MGVKFNPLSGKFDFAPLTYESTFFRNGRWFTLQGSVMSVNNTSGTGSVVSSDLRFPRAQTGATAGSVAELGTTHYLGLSKGSVFNKINFGKPLGIRFLFATLGVFSGDNLGWMLLGVPNATVIAGPSTPCIGLKIDGNKIYGVSRNASDTTLKDTGLTLSNTIVYEITILSKGDGTIKWFSGTTLLGSVSDGFATETAVDQNCFRAALTNGSAASDRRLYLFQTDIYTGA